MPPETDVDKGLHNFVTQLRKALWSQFKIKTDNETLIVRFKSNINACRALKLNAYESAKALIDHLWDLPDQTRVINQMKNDRTIEERLIEKRIGEMKAAHKSDCENYTRQLEALENRGYFKRVFQAVFLNR